MALQSSGQISMTDIVGEFGGSVPHSLSEYYRDGGAVPANNTNVPTSGSIAIGNFYGAVNEIQYTINSGTTNFQTSSAFGSNWTTAVPKRLIINSGVTVGSSSSTPALIIDGSMGGTFILQNSGSIEGSGGSADGGNGGPAVRCDQNGSVTFQNAGAVKGGGGGGGAGGSGGTGGQGGTGGTGGAGSYTAHVGNYYFQYQFSKRSSSNHAPWSLGDRANSPSVWAEWGCRRVWGNSFTQGYQHNHAGGSGYGNQRNTGYARFYCYCYNSASQSGAGGGSGGSGGSGGAGGAGGRGEGYNQSAQSGSSGASGSGGSGGNSGGNNGNNSGQGGTGGTGGSGGTGGTGGAGGSFGNAGATGSTGAQGNTGATGDSGANGNASNGSGGSGGSGGASGSGGSGGGSAGYYIQNRHYLTLQNSGTVLGQ